MKKTVLLLVAALATNVSTYAGQPPSPDVEEWPGMQEAIAESMQTHREEEGRRLAQKLQDDATLQMEIAKSMQTHREEEDRRLAQKLQDDATIQMGIAESMQTHREEEARRAAQASEITPANHEAGRQAITLHEISQVREQLQNIASDTKITQITIAGRDLPIRRFNGQIFVQIPTNGAGINMCPLMSLGTIPASTAAEAQAIATRIATNLQALAKLHAPDGLASNFMVWSNGRNPADVPQEIFDGNGINYSVLWHFLTGTEGHADCTDYNDPIWWIAMEEALDANIHILSNPGQNGIVDLTTYIEEAMRSSDSYIDPLISAYKMSRTLYPARQHSKQIYIFGVSGHYSLLVPLPETNPNDTELNQNLAFQQALTTILNEIARNNRYIGK